MESTQRHPPLATLRLYADTLDPAVVSKLLSVEPELAAKKGGGMTKRADGTQVSAKAGTWFVTTRRRKLGSNPARHLLWVYRLISPKFDVLKKAVPDLRADFSLLVHDNEFETKNLPAQLLQDVVALGELEIEIPERALDMIVDSKNIHKYIT